MYIADKNIDCYRIYCFTVGKQKGAILYDRNYKTG